jgi:hypothetical protein
MNNTKNKHNIVFCIVNDISSYATKEIKETIQNILDFTISNLYIKGYKVLIGKDEDLLLKKANEYDYAIVMSPGTEYINGFNFFNALNNLLDKDFFIAGHILDRTKHNAYYELHHQCYVINLKYYRALGCPEIGKSMLNESHIQIEPLRSSNNFHDDYTPIIVTKGNELKTYDHKCHGWNILKLAFENDLPVLVFDDNIRNSKKHYYPEVEEEFNKHKNYIDYKLDFCKNELIHTKNTEWSTGVTKIYNQIVIPASGTLYLDLIKEGIVIFYDYNQKALDYYKENCIRKNNIEYKFIKTDLLHDLNLLDHLNLDLSTFINLSNIFCYEGTASKYSLEYRLNSQNRLVDTLKNKVKNIDINFTMKANDGHPAENADL